MSSCVIFCLRPELFLGTGPVPKCSLPTTSKRSSGNVIMRWREIHCGRLCHGVNGSGWKAAERRYLQKSDHVLAVSENDQATFARFLDPQKLTVALTGVDTEFFQASGERRCPTRWFLPDLWIGFPMKTGLFLFRRRNFSVDPAASSRCNIVYRGP